MILFYLTFLVLFCWKFSLDCYFLLSMLSLFKMLSVLISLCAMIDIYNTTLVLFVNDSNLSLS